MAAQYTDKFVAFIDILGFSDLIRASVNGTGRSLDEINAILADIAFASSREEYGKYGQTICPASKHVQKDLDFQSIQISDCLIVSAEISPAGINAILDHCWRAAHKLLRHGLLCRGYVTRGHIHHTSRNILGTGYLDALHGEKNVTAFKNLVDEVGTPFIEIDKVVCDYIENETDQCSRKVFSERVRTEFGTSAIFPFQLFLMLSQSSGPSLNVAKEKETVEFIRTILRDLILKVETIPEKPPVKTFKKPHGRYEKKPYYINALKAALVECDEIDRMIDDMAAPFPRML